jgi:hypothetical protein
MSTSGLRHLEAARHSVRVEQLPALARALSTTVHALLVDMRLVRRARKTPPARQGALVGGSLEGDGSTAATGMGHRPRSGYQQDPDRETPRDAEGDGDPA